MTVKSNNSLLFQKIKVLSVKSMDTEMKKGRKLTDVSFMGKRI